MGDINGDIEQFSVCKLMLREEGWTDLGANADMWGGHCWAENMSGEFDFEARQKGLHACQRVPFAVRRGFHGRPT